VPSAYPKEEVEKLLVSIDRGNPKENGIMPSYDGRQIRIAGTGYLQLCFNNLNVATIPLKYLQEKTKEPLGLTTAGGCGLAIIDYLKYASRNTNSSNAIFLRFWSLQWELEAHTLHSIVTQRSMRQV